MLAAEERDGRGRRRTAGRDELERWLEPFLGGCGARRSAAGRRSTSRGLLLPGERKSVEPMAARVAPGDTQQLHHFVSTSPWATAPLEDELVKAADRLVGGPDAVLVVDDTALVKQGRRSVGVKRQYCGQLGKRANCQALVSLTLARAEVPVGVGLRLFLPEDWCADAGRRAAAGVPEAVAYRPKWRSRWTRSTACWPPAPGSAACWPTRSTAGPPSSAPASRSGGSPTRWASRRSSRSTRPT
jgi:SRSO17 transposase